jgi:hypothetical protein
MGIHMCSRLLALEAVALPGVLRELLELGHVQPPRLRGIVGFVF